MQLKSLISPSVVALCATSILCTLIFYAVVKAQERQGCFMVNSSGQIIDLDSLCSTSSNGERIMQSTPENFFLEGRRLGGMGQFQEAVQAFSRAIELDPEYVEAYAFRGMGFAAIGNYRESFDDLQKAAAIARSQGQEEYARRIEQQIEINRDTIEADQRNPTSEDEEN